MRVTSPSAFGLKKKVVCQQQDFYAGYSFRARPKDHRGFPYTRGPRFSRPADPWPSGYIISRGPRLSFPRAVALRQPSHTVSRGISFCSLRCLFEIPILFVGLFVFHKTVCLRYRLPLSKIKRHKLNGARSKKLSEKRAAAAVSSMELMAAILRGTDCSAT